MTDIVTMLEAYAEKAYASAYRLTGNDSDACDLVQESFIRAIEKQHLYDSRYDFNNWLNQILYRVYLNNRRSKDRRHEVRLETVAGQYEKPEVNYASPSCEMPDSIVEKQEVKRAIHAALIGLPAEMRVCVALIDLEGYSYEEAAKIMGCSVGSVSCWLFRARRILRGKLTRLNEVRP